MFYPALGLVAALCAYPVKWGPTVLFLMRIRAILRELLLIWHVFGWHLGCSAAVLLQKRIEVVLVLLVGRGQMRAGLLARMPLLGPLETVALVRWWVVWASGVAGPDRLAACYAVLLRLLRGVVLLVASHAGGNAAAERLLLGLGRVDSRRCGRRLVGPTVGWVGLVAWLRRAGLLLKVWRCVAEGEMCAESVGLALAGRPLRVLLSVRALGGGRGRLLLLLLLRCRGMLRGVCWPSWLAVCGRESLCGDVVVVYRAHRRGLS